MKKLFFIAALLAAFAVNAQQTEADKQLARYIEAFGYYCGNIDWYIKLSPQQRYDEWHRDLYNNKKQYAEDEKFKLMRLPSEKQAQLDADYHAASMCWDSCIFYCPHNNCDEYYTTFNSFWNK